MTRCVASKVVAIQFIPIVAVESHVSLTTAIPGITFYPIFHISGTRNVVLVSGFEL